jgi:hypothetical protein
MAFLNAVSFFEIFSPIKLFKNSNSLGDILVKFLNNPLTDGKLKTASKLEPLYTCVQLPLPPPSALFSFSSNRNEYKCTKQLLAAKTSLGLL